MNTKSPERPNPQLPPTVESTNASPALPILMPSPENTITPPHPPIAAGRKSCTTFTQLFVEHRRITQTAGLDRETITYHLSRNRAFLTALGLDESADPLFIAEEDAFRRETGRAIAALGFVDGEPAARNLRSAVARVRATFLLRHEGAPISAASPESFHAFWPAFMHYATIACKLGWLGTFPLDSKRFAGLPRHPNGNILRDHGIPQSAVGPLMHGTRCVLSGFLEERFHTVERLLRVAPSTLTRHLTFRGNRVVDPKLRSKHSIRYGEAGAFRYAVKITDWPKGLRQEVDDFFREKMKTRWATRNDGYCGSAEHTLSILEAFVGWLRLPITNNKWRSGGGKDLGTLQSVFAELVTPDTLESYMEFRIAHTMTEAEFQSGKGRRVFNNTLRSLFHFAAHLLAAPHQFKRNLPVGFVFRNPDRYAKLLEHLLPTSTYDQMANGFVEHHTTHQRWMAFCKKARSFFFETLEGSENTGRAGNSRSTDAGIEEIVVLPNPRVALAELLVAIERDYGGYSWEDTPHEKAFFCRRQLFFELITIVPHRIRIWSVLTRRNFVLRAGAEGLRTYHLHIEKAEFKNHRHLEMDYELDLPARLTALIDSYFIMAWPILNAPFGMLQDLRNHNRGRVALHDANGAVVPISKDPRYASLAECNLSDRVFGTAQNIAHKKADPTPLTEVQETKRISHSLQSLSVTTTGRFLGARYKTNGFYPHAFRHIAATAEIRTTGSYERAALLLWDSVEMVRKAYSHVKRCDLLAGVVQAQELELTSLRGTGGGLPKIDCT